MWQKLFVLTKAIYPALRVLRLADRSEAGMHMLYYFWRMARISLHNSQLELNNITTFVECGDDGDDLSDGNDDIQSDDDNWDDRKSNNTLDMNNNLGKNILLIWNKRKNQIVNDFAVLGWLLCPVEEVHIDMMPTIK